MNWSYIFMAIASAIPLILMIGGMFILLWILFKPPSSVSKFHKYQVGQDVIFVNDFGVCWGIRKIVELDIRSDRPTYYTHPTDAPWYSIPEKNLLPVSKSDYSLSPNELQEKYGFTPTEYFGCY